MNNLHIYRPRGYYIGQVRYTGCQKWDDATGRCKSAEAALAKAVLKMRKGHLRARALFVDISGYYGATVMMEAKR